MTPPAPERDWKYMKKVKEDLLAVLCEQMNGQAMDILKSEANSERERYGRLYRHVQDSDDIVADCFDDWRRSTLLMKLVALQRHGLLTSDHMQHLSEETQKMLKALKEL
ncbi:MAG: hypothetical protein MUO68_00950 [Desulfobacteraceae bacterium]|nr:hypothetical protein [Desulfobacteraceae bacterium]